MATIIKTRGPGHDMINRLLKVAKSVHCKVGWLESAKYPDGTPVAYVAAIHEFGYPAGGITPRLGLRANVIPENLADWRTEAKKAARMVLTTGDMAAGLNYIGGRAAAHIRKRISDVQGPILAESTIRARASRMGIEAEDLTGTGGKPLVEPVMSKRNGLAPGGLLLATATHIVSEGQGPMEGDMK